jgi:hypothetical protein
MSESLHIRFLGRLHPVWRSPRSTQAGAFLQTGFWFDVTDTLPTRQKNGITREEIVATRGIAFEWKTRRSDQQRRLLCFVPDALADRCAIHLRSDFVSQEQAIRLARRATRLLGCSCLERKAWAAGVLGRKRVHSFKGLTKNEAIQIERALTKAEEDAEGGVEAWSLPASLGTAPDRAPLRADAAPLMVAGALAGEASSTD